MRERMIGGCRGSTDPSITEEYVQVQVVNVSTGEFEGNVKVNL